MSTAPQFHYTNQLPHPADGIHSTQELGAIYTPEKTIFRVWAPTATRLTLHLYEAPHGGIPNQMAMHRLPDGCWEASLPGDWVGLYYTYRAEGLDPRFDPDRELLDPYARCITGHGGRSIVVHDTTPVADRPDLPLSQAILYELHLRDFTIDPDSGIQRRGKYLGLTEEATHLVGRRDIATGLAHLLDLGVTVVQLMPIQAFHSHKSEDGYGWGYDVVHHYSPDGWYATERFDARRVSEVKRMVDTLHRHGLRVTMDVVFNHTFESTDEQRIYSFEGLVPGYYYRIRHDGTYWNGSGVGNEFRTEAPMARRYILDTLRHWVTEYKIDGFRFDLLGLIDHETLREIVRSLRDIDPGILIYGEPWAGGTSAIEVVHKGRQRGHGWAVFNDHYRDALKGNVFDARETGFLQSGRHVEWVKAGLRGAVDDFADTPLESINYVECHDNHTLWDRLLISTIDDPRILPEDRQAMVRLAAFLLFTAQGIPFLQTGQASLRTKNGDHNSYDKPDPVNMVRWERKAAHLDLQTYHRELIALRRNHPLLRMESAVEVRRGLLFLDDHFGLPVPPGCLAYQIEDLSGQDSWTRALALVNANPHRQRLPWREGKWKVHVFGQVASRSPLPLAEPLTGLDLATSTLEVEGRSAILLAEWRSPFPLS
jgi:pullulanase